jgi:hypothetical protein
MLAVPQILDQAKKACIDKRSSLFGLFMSIKIHQLLMFKNVFAKSLMNKADKLQHLSQASFFSQI